MAEQHPDVPAADRIEIVDALYRFAAGQDIDDREIFASAFSADATLDFTHPAQRLGAAIPVFEGRQGITDTILVATNSLDTTHTITNVRVFAYDGKTAATSALIEAQHLPKGDHRRYLLLKHIPNIGLSRAGRRWTIDEMTFRNVRFDGDPAVLFPQADATARTSAGRAS